MKAKQDAVLARWKALQQGEVAEFGREAEELKIPRVAPAPKIER